MFNMLFFSRGTYKLNGYFMDKIELFMQLLMSFFAAA